MGDFVVVPGGVNPRPAVTQDVILEDDVVHLGPRCGPILVPDREEDREPALRVRPVLLEDVPLDEDTAGVLYLEQVLRAPAGAAVTRVVRLPSLALGESVVPARDV